MNKQDALANVSGMLAELMRPKQPQIADDLILLYAGYRVIDGPLLDLYGTFDRDGYEVEDISLSTTMISLYEIIDELMLKNLSDWCDLHLANCCQMYAEAKMEAAIDAAEDKKLYD
jgi:hypothetical protein